MWIALELQWRNNDRDGVSNHQPHNCLLNRLLRSMETSKLRLTGLWEGNYRWPVNFPHKWPVTRKMFPFDDVIVRKVCTQGQAAIFWWSNYFLGTTDVVRSKVSSPVPSRTYTYISKRDLSDYVSYMVVIGEASRLGVRCKSESPVSRRMGNSKT